MKTVSLALCFLLGLAATPALAGEGCGAKSADAAVGQIFDSADRNGDGALSATEYAEAGLERFGVSFAESDTDADGRTSRQEYMELYRKHHTPDPGVSL